MKRITTAPPVSDDPLGTLRALTLLESPSGDTAALAALAGVLEPLARRAGMDTARRAGTAGDHLLWSLPARGVDGPPLLFLSHYDTVWPTGTLDSMPWSVEGDVVRGPGVYDTKAGIVALLAAVERVVASGEPHPEVRAVVVADEEVGSPTAGDLVRSEAESARAVLGLEPPHPGGDLKTGRRGSTRARIEVTGVESHAALDPDAGTNAIDELIDQLLGVREVASRLPVLLNTGTVRGGGRTNVVAGRAHADLGLRFADPENERTVLGALEGLTPVRPHARVASRLLSHRPTWREDDASRGLAASVAEIAAGIGQSLGGRPADGAADTNTTGALGVPTVDGLAPHGGGAHARDEWVSASGLTERIDLLAALVTGLHRTV
ncbi:M20/M25/M40 family metallo-hydrolase [Nocardiopsis sp. NPDC057823]|uniref:M20/M25/M40 family metallo-hydrolase n=1 Tax=Nocardiopsis sp. NPDC057823 TaxID=3346256 RepID=UPI00366F7004